MGSPSGCVVAQYAFDGLGAQVSRRLCALADARATGARYIHRPFPPPGFEHTAGNDSAAAEAAFSLGAGAVVVDSPKALRLCTRLVACSSEHYSVADLLATAHAARKRFRPSSVWRCRKDATVLHVAHRLSAIADVERVLVFEDGELVEDGSPAELLRAGGRYRRLVDAEAEPSTAALKA